MRSFVSILICLLLLSPTVFAATNLALENAQRQLQLLDPLQEEEKALRDMYLQIIDTHSQLISVQAQITAFKEQLRTLPKQIEQLQKNLHQEQQQTRQGNPVKGPLSELELALTQLQSSQLELQQKRSKIENEISLQNSKPVELRSDLRALSQSQISIDNNASTQAQQQLDEALFALSNAKIQAINFELLVIPLKTEYDRLKLSWTEIELLTLADNIRLYQDKIQLFRQSETDKLLAQVSTAQNKVDNRLAVTLLLDQNASLSEQLRDTVKSQTTAVERLRILEQQQQLIQQSYKVIQQQLELSENSFGIELRHFSQRFSIVAPDTNTLSQIAKLRLKNIELNQLKLDMTTNRPKTTSWSTQERQDLAELQVASTDIINNLHKAYGRELDQLSKILTLETQISQQFAQGQKLLTEYLLWLPSVPSVDSQWPRQISQSTTTELKKAIANIGHIRVNPSSEWLRWALLYLLISAISFSLLKHQRQHQKIWSRQIGNVIHDKFSRSVRLLLAAPIICLPIPLLLYLLLNKVVSISDLKIPQINDLLCLSLWVYLSFNYWLKRPYGLFISHLDIPEDFCLKLKKLLTPLYILGAPLAWLLLYFDNIPSLELHSGLGRLVFILLSVLAGSFWAALWKVSPHRHTSTDDISWWQQSKLWFASMIIIHAGLIIGALFGYLFTGSMIITTLLAISLIVFSVFAIYRLCLRWLLIAERRLTFSRARARRNKILAARENNQDIPALEENYLGLKSISEQAATLLKVLCFGLLSIGMWLLVKNFLPSLDVLDNIVVWSNDITTASGVISESISLGSVITGLFVIGLSILAAYNLPGLLELLILRHINLTPGTSYAITSITRYLLIIISILAGAGQVGVEWAKLQWLIAAMGVGLGFGLQEIVANFVSGIIILFEKPVRIGDTVTIGGVTGKVTKIKIRATTISDWDRKEVIIPNKTFVTDQLINWSLSDAITRVTLNIGVAYGTDTTLVHTLILSAANANERVLKVPEPEVFFTTFGNSTLDFELRFFTGNLTDRNLAIHEINQQINRVFADNNVSIAFPQLDVHLHRAK